jgi:hypothetical protein
MRYHPSMQRTFGACLFVIVAAVLVSAGPKFISKWSAPEARGVTFAGKKVAAVVMTQDDSLRVSGEEALSQELTARGMQGVASYRMIPKEELQDPDKAKGWFERASVEGVVVLRPVSAEKERTYPEPTVWAAPYYGTLWGYYGYGWGVAYSPGSVREDTVIVVETLIFSVPMNKLLWAAASETRNPKTLQKFVTDLVKETAKEIQKLRGSKT